MEKNKKRDQVFLGLYFKTSPDMLTEEELTFFRDHPEAIDEVTAPVNVHKFFLWLGTLLGVSISAFAKWLKFSGITLFSEGFMDFSVDVLFEIGVALIGAAVTAYILGILLNKQQEKAAHWRAEIRKKINQK